jgi:beta-glucosidase
VFSEILHTLVVVHRGIFFSISVVAFANSRKGADVRGYSVWSFMDLYELFGGFKKHYGLVAVDFDTKERRRQPRRSAHWYSDFLKNNAAIELERDFMTKISRAEI